MPLSLSLFFSILQTYISPYFKVISPLWGGVPPQAAQKEKNCQKANKFALKLFL